MILSKVLHGSSAFRETRQTIHRHIVVMHVIHVKFIDPWTKCYKKKVSKPVSSFPLISNQKKKKGKRKKKSKLLNPKDRFIPFLFRNYFVTTIREQEDDSRNFSFLSFPFLFFSFSFLLFKSSTSLSFLSLIKTSSVIREGITFHGKSFSAKGSFGFIWLR